MDIFTADIKAFQSQEVERKVLGMALTEGTRVQPLVIDGLRIEDFSDPDNRVIFSAMERSYREGNLLDPITILDYIRTNNLERRMRNRADQALMELSVSSLVPSDLNEEIKYLKYYSARRALRAGIQSLADDIERTTDIRPLYQGLIELKDKVEKIATNNLESGKKGLKEITHYLEGFTEYLVSGSYIRTGNKKLDSNVNFSPGQLCIIAARPSMGKSWMGVELCRLFYQQGTPVAFFSIEMNPDELTARFVSNHSGINLGRISPGVLSTNSETASKIENGLAEFTIATNDLLFIDPCEGPIRTKQYFLDQLEQVGVEKGQIPQVVIVDYLQYLVPRGADNQNEKIGYWTQAFKEIAREKGILLIVLAQLNRGLEARNDKRPTLADGKGSGNIEEDADIFMALHRPAKYDESLDPNELEILVLKVRNGITGAIDTEIDIATGRLKEG